MKKRINLLYMIMALVTIVEALKKEGLWFVYCVLQCTKA